MNSEELRAILIDAHRESQRQAREAAAQLPGFARGRVDPILAPLLRYMDATTALILDLQAKIDKTIEVLEREPTLPGVERHPQQREARPCPDPQTPPLEP